MKILFVSDYVCPYCLVAKEAMKQAIEEMGITPEITWHPFELTVEPAPRVDTYNDRTRRLHYQVLVKPCQTLGLDMKLPPNIVPRPYSRLAFEGYLYAKEQGKGDIYNDLMYRAYFIHEEDIGEMEVLCKIAAEAGLNVENFRKALEEGVYKAEEEAYNRHAREELHVKHVPTIYVDGKEVSVTKYTKEEFMEIFANAGAEEEPAEEEAKAEDEEPSFGGCGPDGCSF